MTVASSIPVLRPSSPPTRRGCRRSPAPVLRNGRTLETVKRPQADLSVGSMRDVKQLTPVLRFRGWNHIDASITLVLRSALARVSKDGHKRDRASGHP